MTAQSESTERRWALSSADLLRLFQQIGHLIAGGGDSQDLLQSVAERIGSAVRLDRCTFILCEHGSEELPDAECRFSLVAQHAGPGLKPITPRDYEVGKNSEVTRILLAGKPVPLSDILAPSSAASAVDLAELIKESNSKSTVAFPMMAEGRLVGCMLFHQCAEATHLPEEILQLGEAIAEELAVVVARNQTLSDRETESKVFRDMAAPALIIERLSGRILQANDAVMKILSSTRRDLQGRSLLQAIPDGQRLLDGGKELTLAQSNLCIANILIGAASGEARRMDACLSRLGTAGRDDLLVIFMPAAAGRSETAESADVAKLQRAEELASALNRQLSWERWVRQIICKLHATLDRDTLLQTVVDGFGRALGASRCLIVRTDGPASPMVTHEYVEPDISPLGLGRTGQFPPVAVSFFKHKVGAISDLAQLEKNGELTPEGHEYFLDNGIRSMVGAPITAHGITYGVIIILESGAGRKWSPHELDMLEIAAGQTAVALTHSQGYLQLKDQLFNMNLLGNLAQQLTNTLELVSRGGKPDTGEEKSQSIGNSPPLSLRELEVLKLIAGGLANREIAQRLFLTESTVELHASRIRKKLKLKSRTALVKYACDNGLA